MSLVLRPFTEAELTVMAAGGLPSLDGLSVLHEALPPGFIAARSLAQLKEGKPMFWCSTFAMVRPADRAVVGGCGFKDAPLAGCVEIGYGVSPQARGQGFATAAVRQLLDLAFAAEEIQTVLAHVNASNLASTRVVTRAGFIAGEQRQDRDGEWLVQWRCGRNGFAPTVP